LVKPELGIKRSCLNCAAHFYDLGRDPIICPKCGHSHTAESFMKMRRARPGSPDDRKAAAKRKVELRPEPAEAPDPFDAEAEEEADAEEEVIEDTSDLGGDDDIGGEIPRESDDPNER
jgi:uncharacterized protein (TIGR02300 family)